MGKATLFVWRCAPGWPVSYTSPSVQNLLGVSAEDLTSGRILFGDLVHPDDLSMLTDAVTQSIRDGAEMCAHDDYRVRHADGRWIWVHDVTLIERDDAGNVTSFIGYLIDVTAQKDAEIEARRASHAKSEFLARMSHEIRTPLNGVLGVLQLLEHTRLDETQSEYIEVLRESGETLLSVINDILDTSKIEAGQLKIESRPFDVHRMLRTVHNLHRERAHSKGLRYVLSVDDDLPRYLIGDSHRIRQVLSNLLSNALKFTQAGEVELKAHAVSDRGDSLDLAVEVRDTGPGIANTAEVWEPFRQADASTSRRYGGTGLGLSIARQLTLLMGGTIDVTSQLGRGTEFVIRLPLEVAGQVAPLSPGPRAIPSDLPTLDILVAEDNAINQVVICGVLNRLRQRVTLVEDGHAALARCREQHFDLVLMDIHMPGISGIEASRQIRATLPAERQPRIVAISADAFAPRDDLFETADFDDSIAKPFRLAEIVRAIEMTR